MPIVGKASLKTLLCVVPTALWHAVARWGVCHDGDKLLSSLVFGFGHVPTPAVESLHENCTISCAWAFRKQQQHVSLIADLRVNTDPD